MAFTEEEEECEVLSGEAYAVRKFALQNVHWRHTSISNISHRSPEFTFRCNLVVNGGAGNAHLTMTHRAPYSAHEVMKTYASLQSPLDDTVTQSDIFEKLNDLYYVRQKQDQALEWELVPRRCKVIGPATKPFDMPMELIHEIVGHIEPGLVQTLRNLRLVSRQFKACVDERLFKYVTLNRANVLSAILGKKTRSLAPCRILNVRSIPSHAEFATHHGAYDRLPTGGELRTFAIECCDTMPVVIGSEPRGHLFVGWHTKADHYAAAFIDRIYSLKKPVWPRKLHPLGSKIVDLTLVVYSPRLSDEVREAVIRAAKSSRKNCWPTLVFEGGETPTKVRQLTPVPREFSVQVLRFIERRQSSDMRAEQGYWRDLTRTLKDDMIKLQVQYIPSLADTTFIYV